MSKIISKTGVRIVLCILTIGFSGCSQSPQSESAQDSTVQVYAVVGSRTITEADLEREYARKKLLGLPKLTEEETLEELIERAALVEYARDLGLADDPVVAHRMDSLLIHALRQQSQGRDPALEQVSEEAVTAAYRERLDDFTIPGATRLAVLFIEVSNKLSSSQQTEAEERLREAVSLFESQGLSGNQGFGRIASEYSDEQLSRYRGGDVGWIPDTMTNHRIPSAVLEAGRGLDVGVTSDVITLGDGCWIVMKTGARPATVRPLEAVNDLIRNELIARKQAERVNAHLADALSAVTIQRLTTRSDDS
ncbi:MULTISPECIES: peptidylprolyl isomerase [unclassified Lentimonas]|uniref:peptidylprolyl isomerase n=1 Tax=unclassified Lentimonas TaxID=2630993 RepID=UPI00132980D4|nr:MULTISPECIES: peptidyl-prolyl cis-trans isomerase [unclassified Lentimonas]CAA6676859.1 Unannotated [Lentimonas sp. CC4]CAA6686666.1 Unannotated [Lentimonas sp. CC6]CAA6692982.1 Unannotated [Lentimonas sp. CC10]CAA6695664.1 Unannotated [Lentimonas sp. CC19]CAA7069972.1 Unannotated [Lentimonas sp. CC11]